MPSFDVYPDEERAAGNPYIAQVDKIDERIKGGLVVVRPPIHTEPVYLDSLFDDYGVRLTQWMTTGEGTMFWYDTSDSASLESPRDRVTWTIASLLHTAGKIANPQLFDQ